MKTTNAKAKAFQTPSGPAPAQDIEKTKGLQTSARRPKRVIHAETSKIQVHGDESPLADREVEYAPPRPKDLPYESEDFPDNCLNYDLVKGGNLARGMFAQHLNPVDENGLTKIEREYDAAYQKSVKELDDSVLKMMEDNWTIGDVPETFVHLKKRQLGGKENVKAVVKKTAPLASKGPATIDSRKAAFALSSGPKPGMAVPKSTKPKPTSSFLSRPKPAPTAPQAKPNLPFMASRSTIGYTKGRNASTAMKSTIKPKERGMARSVSNMSQDSDTTITPDRFARATGEEEYRRPDFLSAFMVDDDDEVEPVLRGELPESLRRDDEDEEFVLTWKIS
jgi:hypothetical protein